MFQRTGYVADKAILMERTKRDIYYEVSGCQGALLLPLLMCLVVGCGRDASLLDLLGSHAASPQDSTRKAKSVLLYKQVQGGVLVSNYTVVCNTAIPTIVQGIMNKYDFTCVTCHFCSGPFGFIDRHAAAMHEPCVWSDL